MKLKGKLIRWNKERGFGFIKADSIKGDIFIHISKLNTMSRKPIVGDLIHFKLVKDKNKNKAIKAKIEGVKTKGRSSKFKKIASSFILLIIILTVAYTIVNNLSSTPSKTLTSVFKKEDFSGFSCKGKIYCSQMNSCKEARFYLMNCPGVKIDGNNDGEPCESQWCN